MKKVSAPISLLVAKYSLAQIKTYKLPTSAAVSCEVGVLQFQKVMKVSDYIWLS